MKTKWTFLVVFFTLGLLFASNAQSIKEKVKDIDYEALAHKLVNQCANIHEGEFVLISGGLRNLELLEDIAVNVRKLGAFPLLTIDSDRLTRRMYTDVPVKYDTQVPELDLKLLSFVTAIISVDYREKMDLLADIPPARFIEQSKASEPATDLYLKRNIKIVNLGNVMYPTEARAKRYGLTLEELTDIFWTGVNGDYSKLEKIGKEVKEILMVGKELQITNVNGTDIRMGIENRKVFVSDGVITEEDMKQGSVGLQMYLPTGEVFFTPVPGTAEGIVVFDRFFHQDKEVAGLTLTVKAGKVISMSAKSGIEPFKAFYDAAEPGKEEFSTVDLGINPDVHLKQGSKLGAFMPAGMVTVGIGNNIGSGGENKSPFGYAFFLPGSTVKVDGKVLVENGVLK